MKGDLAPEEWTVGLCCNCLKSGNDFRLNGADVFVFWVDPFGVVEAVDIGAYDLLGMVEVAEIVKAAAFKFESREKALDHDIIPAVALAAHAATHPETCGSLDIVIGAGGGASIRVVGESGPRIRGCQIFCV